MDNRTEMGLCALHQRKRAVRDLVPLPGQAGAFRCVPLRECFGKDGDTATVTCALHGKKRNRVQMMEVRAGVWECKAAHQCRFDNVVGGGVGPTAANALGAGPGGGDRGVGMTAGATRPGGPGGVGGPGGPGPAAAPLPASNMRTAITAVGGGAGRFDGAELSGLAEEVWCTRHGRRLPRAHCVAVYGLFHVCADAARCTANPVEHVAALAAKGCRELICHRHNRARRLPFLEVDVPADGSMPRGYRCRADHTCANAAAAERID